MISSLLPVVARAHRNLAAALLREFSLAPGQELVLMMLWVHEPLVQADITRDLAVEPPTVAKMLSRMENAGLISRERSTEDRRNVLVSLTDAGRALETPVRTIWEELEFRTARELSPAQQQELLLLLGQVLQGIGTPPPSQAAW
ncbi:MarR family winged helix-turn-helix transcriptional regulator [Curtobacterium sp. ME26]|uniref:MarR family winged helix-turn-helix transcriptional regulator n=1 Tax=Curtobacterium sp. ME26 TaxID=2744254 RepID=UPI0015F5B628|nr:MarR family transcriptional regulator [Curtobacterium sp. ME26]